MLNNIVYNILLQNMNINSQRSSILKAFNKHFQEMFDNILEVYPDNLEILTAKTSSKTISSLNPTTLIKAWFKFVVEPYLEIIEQGNIDFFFQKDYSADLAHLSSANDVLVMIDRVRAPLQQMNEENQSHIKHFLLNLSKLSIMYSK